MLRIDFLTLFPEIVNSTLSHSIMKRAVQSGAVRFETTNPRDYCYDSHLKVDDVPYGGEPGMLIKAEPMALALEAIGACPRTRDHSVAVISTDPTGVRFDQQMARDFASLSRLVFLCGHYEGIDHRLTQRFCTHSVSIGDFVLTNGELPALAMADAVVRLLKGVLGSESSLEADSHSDGLLSAPNYTRPEIWRGEPIPEILKSGNHEAIRRWRRNQALKATKLYRPDLLARAKLDKRDLNVLSS
jgi:tRNA (guanine37-N1)-methyltransferase